MEIIIGIFNYIRSAPYFWGSMGFVVAIAMLIGTIVYGSNYKQIYKFILSLFIYLILLAIINFTRANDALNLNNNIPTHAQRVTAYASTGTIIIVTFFWVSGLFLGLAIDKCRKLRRG